MSLFREHAGLPFRQPEIRVRFPYHDLAIGTNTVVDRCDIKTEAPDSLHKMGTTKHWAVEVLLIRLNQLVKQMSVISEFARYGAIVAGFSGEK